MPSSTRSGSTTRSWSATRWVAWWRRYGGLGHPARGIVERGPAARARGFKDALEPIRPMLEGDDAEIPAAMQLVFGLLDGPLPEAERARLGDGLVRVSYVLLSW